MRAIKNTKTQSINTILKDRKGVYGEYPQFKKKLSDTLILNNFFNAYDFSNTEYLDIFFLCFKLTRLESEIQNKKLTQEQAEKCDSFKDCLGYLQLILDNKTSLKKLELPQGYSKTTHLLLEDINARLREAKYGRAKK